MTAEIRIAGIRPRSAVDGEGIRYVVFLQGCAHHCKGCHNPETWDFDGGRGISIEQLAEYIRTCKYIDGVTLSGGDPFYQHDACVQLLNLIPDMNVWVYTGFEYDEIKDTELARRADVLVTGPYVEELRCEGKMYGSSNQRIIRKESISGEA